jgi:essential nuclear protein 1
MPRTSKTSEKTRHDPLLVQLKQDELHAKYGRVSQPGKRKKSRKVEGEAHETEVCFHVTFSIKSHVSGKAVLDSKTSQRIFELARDQQEELEHQDADDEEGRSEFMDFRTQSFEREDHDPSDDSDVDEDIEDVFVRASSST